MAKVGFADRIRECSDHLVRLQKPIRILEAVKWPQGVRDHIVKSRFKSYPILTAKDFPVLGFDAAKRLEDFRDLKLHVKKVLGPRNAVSKILQRNCDQYTRAIELVQARGTQRFFDISKELYGHSRESFGDRKTTLLDLSLLLDEIFKKIEGHHMGVQYPLNVTSRRLQSELQKRLRTYFHRDKVDVILDDGIVSDAAAGSSYIKIKKGKKFSTRDIDLLEVHEGWVHVGTTLNGLSQPTCRWLAKGPPCTTAIQEGLAVLMEVIHFVSTPARATRINNRVMACRMAEDGANVLQVYEYFRQQGAAQEEALYHAQRIFRGGILSGGAPFTKDVVYCKGFVTLYNFLRTAVRLGKADHIPFLFCGKLMIEDVPVLVDLYHQGLVDRPKYLPREFHDLNGLTVWMAFSNFFNMINLGQIQKNLAKLF